MDIKVKSECVQLVSPSSGGNGTVNLQGRRLVIQSVTCERDHGPDCLTKVAEPLAQRLWLEKDHSSDGEFSFTDSATLLDSTTDLHTQYGWLKCLPDAEYKLWRKVGLCHASPLVIHLDDVVWRVIASNKAVLTKADTQPKLTLSDNTDPAFKLYLEAHRDGGQLLSEVKEAVSRGEQDLHAHREFLFKIFHIVSMPPTLSHDLSKTKLVNFALGRCFSSDDLKELQQAITFEDCMALVKRLHLEVENHHPEHGAAPALSIVDMYLDRVSRGVQKTHGWSNKAWFIPERFAPANYKDDFAVLQDRFSQLEIVDPGDLVITTLMPAARMSIKWEDVICNQCS